MHTCDSAHSTSCLDLLSVGILCLWISNDSHMMIM